VPSASTASSLLPAGARERGKRPPDAITCPEVKLKLR
jgi:hypothetical protein